MTDLPPPADELASALLDGELTPEGAETAEADPVVRARVRELRSVRDRVAVAPTAPASRTRDRQVAAAADAADWLRSPDRVTASHLLRLPSWLRSPNRVTVLPLSGRWLPLAAAAVLVVLAAVFGAFLIDRFDAGDPETMSAADTAAKLTAAPEAPTADAISTDDAAASDDATNDAGFTNLEFTDAAALEESAEEYDTDESDAAQPEVDASADDASGASDTELNGTGPKDAAGASVINLGAFDDFDQLLAVLLEQAREPLRGSTHLTPPGVCAEPLAAFVAEIDFTETAALKASVGRQPDRAVDVLLGLDSEDRIIAMLSAAPECEPITLPLEAVDEP